MNDGRGDTPSEPPSWSRPGDECLHRLAVELGLELPFKGPLDAFSLGEEPGPDLPIYLGGDLQAVHPDARDRRARAGPDPSLDAARITLDDLENDSVEALAVEGIWCVVLRGAMVDSAPYFSIWDTDGRMRTWLLLPPARLMIGLGHFWLPSVPPPSGAAPTHRDDPPPRA